MNQVRGQHTATLLDDGRVLIVAGRTGDVDPGVDNQVDMYGGGSFTSQSPAVILASALCGATATKLNNGNVLIAGGAKAVQAGNFTSDAQVYDITIASFQPTISMNSARIEHAAIKLNDGTILLTGGQLLPPISTLKSAEYFNGTNFISVSDMNYKRCYHTMTILPYTLNGVNGGVLVAGGFNLQLELYDPNSQSFSVVGSLIETRNAHTATLLNNGVVLFPAAAAIIRRNCTVPS